MPQEFLASFAVDIDEAGVTRLQTILRQNRDLAARLAAAFDTARSSCPPAAGSRPRPMRRSPRTATRNMWCR